MTVTGWENRPGLRDGDILQFHPLRAWALRWMPLVGELEYFCNRLRLKARRRQGVIREWQVLSVATGFVDRVSIVVAEIIGWPNPLFIPDDECVAMFFPLGDVDLNYPELACALQRELALDEPRWQSVESVIRPRAKYVEFVAALYSNVSQAGHAPRG